MLFKNLPENHHFTVQNSPTVYIKIKPRSKTCCTPAHNAVSKDRKKYALVDDNDEVTPIEIQITTSNTTTEPTPKIIAPKQPKTPEIKIKRKDGNPLVDNKYKNDKN